MAAASFPVLFLFGAFIGVAGSALGIGGGIFLVPFLVLALKLPIHQAVAASLVAITATSSAVAAVNVERGLANIRLGIALEVTTALGSIAGALVAGRLPAGTVRFLFALMLFPVAALMLQKGLRGRARERAAAPAAGTAFDSGFFDPALGEHTPYSVRNVGPASFVSFFAGSLSGLLGIGGGVVQVPVMNMLCGVPMKAAAATSNFIIGVSAAASALVYFRAGLVPLETTGIIVSGVLAGSFAGIYALYKVRAEKLQVAFSVFIVFVAVKMLAGR